jgi:2-keto-4-pentenoate hydratase/2-oxohepta-3-ene-1,7-dioic acid hydratase in catechol pathway
VPLPTFFRYDDGRAGVWGEDGAAYDVCAMRHGRATSGETEPAGAAPHDTDACLVAAVLDHRAITELIRDGAPARVRPDRILPPVGRPRNVFGAPVNYHDHRGELGAVRSPAAGTTRELGLFVKAGGSISGAADPIELPDLPGREFHYEGEIAIVIGRPGEDVPAAEALNHVAGFTGALDITMRLEADRREERSMRKSFKTFTPIGPAVLPLADPDQARTLSLELYLNGEPRQRGSLDQLIVGVEELVALASSIVPLAPGDLILTGTPAGVGPLAPGDVVELAVAGLPRLRLPVTVRGARER